MADELRWGVSCGLPGGGGCHRGRTGHPAARRLAGRGARWPCPRQSGRSRPPPGTGPRSGGLRPGLRTLRAPATSCCSARPHSSRRRWHGSPRWTCDLGGPGGCSGLRGRSIRGLQLTYLRAGAADNVRGRPASRRSAARPAAGRRPPRPTIRLRHGRLEGYVRLGRRRAARRAQRGCLGRCGTPAAICGPAPGKLVLELGGRGHPGRAPGAEVDSARRPPSRSRPARCG